jgi:hypothetical protein
MIYRLFLLAGITALACTGRAVAGDSLSVTFGGYVKDLQSVSYAPEPNSLAGSGLLHNRLRLLVTHPSGFGLRLEARSRLWYGEQVRQIPGAGALLSDDPGYADLTWLWADDTALVGVTALDRALFSYAGGAWTVTAGRQRINWGINTVWNPNDIFNASNFLDFDYEERPGADAVRVQANLSGRTSVEAAYSPSRNADSSTAALLFRFNRWQYDVQLLAGIANDDAVAGCGWAGNIGEAGFKGELSLFRSRQEGHATSFTGSVTADYALSGGWLLSGSVLYVEHPEKGVLALSKLQASSITAKNLMPFKWSWYAGLMRSFTPLITGSLAVIYSPDEHSTILFPTLGYDLGQNFDLSLTMQTYFSDTQGEYAMQGNSLYLVLRWSF